MEYCERAGAPRLCLTYGCQGYRSLMFLSNHSSQNSLHGCQAANCVLYYDHLPRCFEKTRGPRTWNTITQGTHPPSSSLLQLGAGSCTHVSDEKEGLSDLLKPAGSHVSELNGKPTFPEARGSLSLHPERLGGYTAGEGVQVGTSWEGVSVLGLVAGTATGPCLLLAGRTPVLFRYGATLSF